MEHDTERTTILVTGAAGLTGSRVTRLLLERGRAVRALVRTADERSQRLADLGADVMVGDLLDLNDVRKALDEVRAAYFVYPIHPGLLEATAVFAQAADEAGSPAVVNMSQISARRESRSRAALQHWIGERLLDRSLSNVTHLRPTFFAEWLLYFGASIANDDVLRLPLGHGRHAPIAGDDQAHVIAAILEDPDPHAGQTYTLVGPEEMDHHEIAAVFSSTLGRAITYESIAFDQFAELLRAGGLSEHLIQHLSEVTIDHRNGVFAGTNDIVRTIGRTTPTSVEDFIEQNRPFYAPSS